MENAPNRESVQMRLIGIICGYTCLGLSFLIVVEIFGRKLLNISIQGVDEIGGYVVAITGTYGMALACWYRAHTRIDIVLLRLPLKVRALFNLIAYTTLTIGAIFMAYMAFTTLAESVDFKSISSTPLQVPLWIPQSLWFSGLICFGLVAAVMSVKGLLMLHQNSVDAQSYLAPSSIKQELEEARK